MVQESVIHTTDIFISANHVSHDPSDDHHGVGCPSSTVGISFSEPIM